jgi:hypothetical protein
MLKLVAAGLTALFVTASPIANAQAPAGGPRLSAADFDRLTDARVNLVKAALQLTPDQEKYWPAVEAAIRSRAKDRQARVAAAAARLNGITALASSTPPQPSGGQIDKGVNVGE